MGHDESLKEIDLKNKVLSSQVDLLKKDIDVESKKCRKLEVSQEQEKLVIQNLEQRISKITEERTELMKQLQNQTENLQTERQSHTESIKTIETQKQALQERVDMLNDNKVRNMRKYEKALDDIKVEQKKLKEIQEINEESEKDKKERDDDEEKIRLKDEEILKLKEDQAKALADLREKLKVSNKSSTGTQENSNYLQQVEDLNKQLLEIKCDLIKSNDTCAELNLLKTKLECEKTEITANSKELTAELESLVASEDKLKKEIEESKALVETGDKKIASIFNDLEHLREG